MSGGKRSEAEISAALNHLEAGRKVEDVAREVGVSKHAIYREWFAKNKARYQQSIVEPALSFIGGFAPHLDKISFHFVAGARPTRGSLFRTYRDTRFSNDKRPFKTHVGIHFSHSSSKDADAPVFYLHLEPDNCFAAAGLWHPDNRALTKVRTAIVRNAEQWAEVRKKLTLEGDRLSRPPRWQGPENSNCTTTS